MKIIISIIVSIPFVLFACYIITNQKEHVKCEGFNIKRIEFDTSYFRKEMIYTNGIYTTRLECTSFSLSNFFEYNRGDGFVGQCEPEFFVQYLDTFKELNLTLGFHYDPLRDNKLKLQLGINSSVIEVELDTINIREKIKIPLGEKYNLSPSTKYRDIIKSVEIENYRITSIEKESGEYWKLDSVKSP